jgi:uncharacterized membrane protein HdeD (DUF308 family)
MDALYEWLLRKARSPSGKVAAAMLISTLFCALVGIEFMTGPAEVAMVLGLGAGIGLLAGVTLTLADRRAQRQQQPGPTGASLGRRVMQTIILLCMLLGLIALLVGIVATVSDALGSLFR